MYITIRITPQRTMIFFIIIALWYCFIGLNEMNGPQPRSFLSKFELPSYPFSNSQLDMKLTNHKQRILTTASDTNNNNNNAILSLNTKDDNTQLFHIKYPPIPSIVGIGPEKCGTTSMAYMLSRHADKIPEIIKPVHEPTGIDCEMRVWLPCGNKNFEESLKNVLRNGAPTKGENYCSLGWYQHFWTPPNDDIRFLHYYLNYMNSTETFIDIIKNNNSPNKKKNKLYDIINNNNTPYSESNPLSWHWKYYYYFEKSPAYWCYEHVAYLFNKLLVPQGTKFFILMRDPIKRTFSYWSHQTGIGHLHGKWPQFITNSLQNKQLQNMINLMKDETKTIMDIKDDLLKEWKDYVYSNDRPYGHIGKRDGTQKNKKPGRRPNRGNIGAKIRRKPLNVNHVTEENNSNLGDMRQKILHEWSKRKGNGRRLFDFDSDDAFMNESRRKLLWTQKDPGYVKADTNPKLGVGASCYVVPLLMWLEYLPATQLSIMQSELMYGGNHNNFVSDVRCWYSLGYEYETMEQCKNDKKKDVVVSEEHMTGSAKGKIGDNEARKLHNQLFKYCNKRLKELLDMDEYKDMPLHEVQWDGWYS
eukprot:245062_1